MSKKPDNSEDRIHWFDKESQAPLIDRAARKLESFISVLADGRVDDHELKAQETRVYNLMKEIEPQLDGPLHAKVTELLSELTAHNLMQTLHEFQKSRPQTAFRG